MDAHLKSIIYELETMIKTKEKDVQLLKMNQPPNQRMIEITQGELLGMQKVWLVIERTLKPKK